MPTEKNARPSSTASVLLGMSRHTKRLQMQASGTNQEALPVRNPPHGGTPLATKLLNASSRAETHAIGQQPDTLQIHYSTRKAQLPITFAPSTTPPASALPHHNLPGICYAGNSRTQHGKHSLRLRFPCNLEDSHATTPHGPESSDS